VFRRKAKALRREIAIAPKAEDEPDRQYIGGAGKD